MVISFDGTNTAQYVDSFPRLGIIGSNGPQSTPPVYLPHWVQGVPGLGWFVNWLMPLLGWLFPGQWVYLKVLGAGTVRIATTRNILENNPNGGLPIVQGDGIQKFQWVGDFYAISSAGNTLLSFETPGRGAQQSK